MPSRFELADSGHPGAPMGMATYGESAPAGDLFKHFGFTVENLVAEAEQLLDDAEA
ncbi:hypothetical protein [Halomonas urmiana]|uniref:hypothetical protein n=1 Tax=Halomonas urmiana TaxID=490901 RepID=UPI00130507AB|nr:hypothetical protein [Halomonas urmiana]